ncbi:MAG: phosphotransferase [Bacteriovoracaceae bacterium]
MMETNHKLQDFYFKKFSSHNIQNIVHLSGDASTRQYFRVVTSNDSYIICQDAPFLENEASHPFLQNQKILKDNNFLVPEIYFSDLSKGLILQEDLGDISLIKYNNQFNDTLKEYENYKKCVDTLVDFHKIDSSKNSKKLFTNLYFDKEKYFFEINMTLEYFFKNLMKNERNNILIRKEFEKIVDPIVAKKMIYTHRDFHSRNIMVKNGKFYLIDFQDARMGIPQYDLVSLLEDCYFSIENKNKDKLIEYYFEICSKKMSDQSREEFLKLYDYMAIERVFKAIGSFAYIYFSKKDLRYIRYIGFGMEKIRNILNKHSELANLRSLIFEIYNEY